MSNRLEHSDIPLPKLKIHNSRDGHVIFGEKHRILEILKIMRDNIEFNPMDSYASTMERLANMQFPNEFKVTHGMCYSIKNYMRKYQAEYGAFNLLGETK